MYYPYSRLYATSLCYVFLKLRYTRQAVIWFFLFVIFRFFYPLLFRRQRYVCYYYCLQSSSLLSWPKWTYIILNGHIRAVASSICGDRPRQPCLTANRVMSTHRTHAAPHLSRLPKNVYSYLFFHSNRFATAAADRHRLINDDLLLGSGCATPPFEDFSRGGRTCRAVRRNGLLEKIPKLKKKKTFATVAF